MELTLSKRQRNITLAVVFTIAGVVYCLISLVNHYLFKTYALDLGLYTHAMFDYAHFRVDDCSMFKVSPQSILSDHFDLYLIILSPLIHVFGSYTLLIVQITGILLGGWGVYKLIGLYTDDDWLPILALATFCFSFGIIQALAFDYHSNVLAAMMLPWLLYFFKKSRFALATLFVVLFVIGKENMSLWLVFIVIGLMWDYRKERKALWLLAAYAIFSVIYFFMINMVVMPRLGGSGGGFYRYEYLGSNYVEIAKNLIMHPKLTLRLLFTSPVPLEEFQGLNGRLYYLVSVTIASPNFAGIKEEFYCCALATGLVFTLLKPNYLFMLIPLIGQKMIACQPNFWGVSYQYSVEFMPILIVSSFLVFIRLKKHLLRIILASCLLLSTIVTTIYTADQPRSSRAVDQIRIYQGQHYEQKKFDVKYARELIKQIPNDVSVSAASMFVPHLALREEIYDLDNRTNADADYVFITWPYFEKIKQDMHVFGNISDYEIVGTDSTIYLLKRVRP